MTVQTTSKKIPLKEAVYDYFYERRFTEQTYSIWECFRWFFHNNEHVIRPSSGYIGEGHIQYAITQLVKERKLQKVSQGRNEYNQYAITDYNNPDYRGLIERIHLLGLDNQIGLTGFSGEYKPRIELGCKSLAEIDVLLDYLLEHGFLKPKKERQDEQEARDPRTDQDTEDSTEGPEQGRERPIPTF